MPARVLLLGRPRDPHVAAVQRELHRRSREAVVFRPPQVSLPGRRQLAHRPEARRAGGGPGLDYSKATLPRAVRERCLRVARALGLDYGGIDLVERPDGEHVFLEINTLPAWLWLEDATGAPITASLVDHLESRATPPKQGSR